MLHCSRLPTALPMAEGLEISRLVRVLTLREGYVSPTSSEALA